MFRELIRIGAAEVYDSRSADVAGAALCLKEIEDFSDGSDRLGDRGRAVATVSRGE